MISNAEREQKRTIATLGFYRITNHYASVAIATDRVRNRSSIDGDTIKGVQGIGQNHNCSLLLEIQFVSAAFWWRRACDIVQERLDERREMLGKHCSNDVHVILIEVVLDKVQQQRRG